ncbi:isochorismate pyruvate lyase [Rubricella aquisinus]|uniref:chorismate mutase n=1 Tax=Rubricella aquisinus TaxID=2028108 RepID=A0A840WFY7_9RHOB|nr:chorismate mutase [Rubricella aquisinus]MBB5514069.1 isochorismate pyruvate lyase [Rubricella aquisinus]
MARTPAQDCASMAELRLGIDEIDRALIALLTERSGYIDRAVDLKKIERLPARTVDRVQQVIDNVRGLAEAQGLDPQLAEDMWRVMIEWAIAREEVHLGSGIPGGDAS